MKPTQRWRSERGLRIATLVFLPLVYLSFSFYEVSFLQTPTAVKSPTTDAFEIPSRHVDAHTILRAQHVRAATELEVAVDEPTPVPVTAPPTPTPAPTTALRGRRTMVLLVNFRDSKRCGETLRTMFEHAVQPELLRVSIHDQIDEALGDLPCVDAYCQLTGGNTKCRRAQITSSKVNASDAQGPTIARYVTEQEIGDEEFCLGLDSHLVFVPDWDVQLVQNWEATENDKAILTVYPKSTEYLENHSKDNQMGLQCYARIETPGADAMVQYQAVHWVDKTSGTKPRLQSQFAGGFNFGSCQAYRDVPNDPHTPILFYGEEYARAARLWTWGYDLYAPSVDVVYHWFETRKKIWDDGWPAKYLIMQRSKRRVRATLGLPTSSDDYDTTEITRFGLGKKRSFAQFQNFSGIDPLAEFTPDVVEQFTNCGELEYVPYDDSSSTTEA